MVAAVECREAGNCEFLKRRHESLAADGIVRLAYAMPRCGAPGFFEIRGISDLNSFFVSEFSQKLTDFGEGASRLINLILSCMCTCVLI